jgi:hypothetical protein
MKTKRIFTLLTGLTFLINHSCAQNETSYSSNTLAYQCVINYIEAFNSNHEQLGNHFISYYENPDIERRLEVESSLQTSWGKLKPHQVIFDSDREIVLLVMAEKIPKDYLLFDLTLSKNMPGKIESFTRTGISIPPKEWAYELEDVMYLADRAVRINDSIIQQTVEGIAKAYDTNYFIPESGKSISTMLINNLSKGKYSQITKAGRLADSIMEDIHEVHFDLHSWVEANRRMLPYDSVAGPADNFGFEKIEKMKGNVGYIKLNEFSPLLEAQVIAGHALDSVSNCKALIFDLRDNHGGYPQMIQFLSGYFFPVPTKINTLYDRNGNIVDELWTQDSIPGKRFNDAFPVIILTSKQTASAAEGFVNF